MTKPNRRPAGAGTSGSSRPAPNPSPGSTAAGVSRPVSRPSSSPSGTRRAGRRETARRRSERGSFLERHRTRLLTGAIVVGVLLVGGWFVSAASTPAYACSSILPANAPVVPGQIGAVEEDMGNLHVAPGTRVRYTYCPPASGNHINQKGFGPIDPAFYGPDDRTQPEGWVHNLEHGAVVVLYSCSLGSCDQAHLDTLRTFLRQWDAVSPVCNVPPRAIGPVVARFEDMAKPYAALLWDRVLYMDTFDAQLVKDFYLKEGEYLNADKTAFVAPPEPQCAVPSASPSAGPSSSAGPSASPSATGSASPNQSGSPSASASPSGSASTPSASPSPSSS